MHRSPVPTLLGLFLLGPVGCSVLPPVRPARESIPRYTVTAGVAVISDNYAHEVVRGKFTKAHGPAAGRIEKLTFAPTLGETDVTVEGHDFHPRWELPLTLERVVESDRAAFPAGSAALALRWVDFPWNGWLPTTLAMGGGLHFTSHALALDEQRHSDHRSHLKFHWPLEVTFALPQAPHARLCFYNDHSSGGGILDVGGFDRFGVALQITF